MCGIIPGDQVTLGELLYGLMLKSGNDAAMSIAVHVGGSVDAFVDLMNQEAARIGATQTHFMNPHGLQDEDHYTTVYDIYLMFQEALKYDEFQDIITHHNSKYRRNQPGYNLGDDQLLFPWNGIRTQRCTD